MRSLLFVPADDERKLARSATSGADAVIVDLEDAVAPDKKALARKLAAKFVQETRGRSEVIVRINGAETEWFADDLAAIATRSVPIMLPKATVETVACVPDGVDVVALIETAAGVEQASAVAKVHGVRRLMLGSADLAAELGITLTNEECELHYPRARLAMGSAASGIESPIDVVHLAVDDTRALRASALRAQRLGFTGKACIHPRQVCIVNEVFSPSEEEIARATAIVRAFEAAASEGRAVVTFEGRLVDRPVVVRAQRTLCSAGQRASPAAIQTADSGGV